MINATTALRQTKKASGSKKKLSKAVLLERLEEQIWLNTRNGIDFAYLNIPLQRFSEKSVDALLETLKKHGYVAWWYHFPKQYYMVTVLWNKQ